MHNAGCMCIAQCASDVAENADGFGDRELVLSCDPCAERLPFDERHREVRQSVSVTGRQERDDVRLLEPSGELDLALEAFGAYARGKVRRENLYDNLSIEAVLRGQ